MDKNAFKIGRELGWGSTQVNEFVHKSIGISQAIKFLL